MLAQRYPSRKVLKNSPSRIEDELAPSSSVATHLMHNHSSHMSFSKDPAGNGKLAFEFFSSPRTNKYKGILEELKSYKAP
jgi:hypothetical protein